MTIAEIRALAVDLGYSISGGTKALLVESFLEAQLEAQGNDPDPSDPDPSDPDPSDPDPSDP